MSISKNQFLRLVELNRGKSPLVEERVGNSSNWRVLGKVGLSLFLVSQLKYADIRKIDNKEVLYMEFDNGYYLERYRINKESISFI